jgi:hypothetical protein
MSVKLFEADYISVIWEKKVSSYVTADESTTEIKNKEVISEYIVLFITLQINWKLKTINPIFEVVDWGILVKTLENWKEWNTLYCSLSDLWYELSRDGDIQSSIMNSWIEQTFR